MFSARAPGKALFDFGIILEGLGGEAVAGIVNQDDPGCLRTLSGDSVARCVEAQSTLFRPNSRRGRDPHYSDRPRPPLTGQAPCPRIKLVNAGGLHASKLRSGVTMLIVRLEILADLASLPLRPDLPGAARSARIGAAVEKAGRKQPGRQEEY